ncbi:hypothetical protein RB653_002225 [Dictyostelium firmibasis]|uniref:Uncharacterized protein n=1 Tax=Dictyostelium firmibasis TaxID=79012 RepID=A0AAN7TQ73_9MYCE
MIFKFLNQLTSSNKNISHSLSNISNETSYDINKLSERTSHYNAILFTRPQMYNF